MKRFFEPSLEILFYFRAIYQIEGEVKLEIPALPDFDENDLAGLQGNKELILKLEEVSMLWQNQVAGILERDLPQVFSTEINSA